MFRSDSSPFLHNKSGTFLFSKKVKTGFGPRKDYFGWRSSLAAFVFFSQSSPFRFILTIKIQCSARACALKSLSRPWTYISFPYSQQKSRGNQTKLNWNLNLQGQTFLKSIKRNQVKIKSLRQNQPKLILLQRIAAGPPRTALAVVFFLLRSPSSFACCQLAPTKAYCFPIFAWSTLQVQNYHGDNKYGCPCVFLPSTRFGCLRLTHGASA